MPSPGADAELLRAARTAPLTKTGIQQLASSHSLEELGQALEEALAHRDIKAGTALALALAARDQRLPAAATLRLIADVDQRDLLPSLLRGYGFDRPSEALELMKLALERGQLSHDREAIVAFIAAEILGPPPWSAPWPGLLRTLARQELGNEAGVLLGIALEKSENEDAKLLGEEWIELSEDEHAREIASFWLDGWTQPILEILPDVEPPKVVAGYTVRKAQDRPGRNDPCHCGSGKKYKKCHAMTDDAQERIAESPHVDAARVSATDVHGMRIQEVLALPFDKLQQPALVEAARQLCAYHRWQDAEVAIDTLAAQPGGAVAAQDARGLLIDEAIRLRALDVLERQLEKIEDRDSLAAHLRAGLSCARPNAETLSALDEEAKRGLSGDFARLLDLAYALLDHAPALGILVSRGALDPHRTGDSDALLDEIELARDRLELPPEDPYGPLYDRWVEDRSKQDELDERTRGELGRLRGELDRAESQVDARQAQVVALEHELRELREQLEQKARQETAAGIPEDEVLAAYRVAEEGRLRLSRKVEELKSLLAENNAERTTLREKIAELERHEEERERAGSESSELALDEEALASPEDEATLPVRIPHWDRKALDALATMPLKVQRQAVSITGRLGGGERPAWRDVKRMQGMEGVFTARLGIHHRLIFTVTTDELRVRDLVTREALLTTLERFR